MKSAKGTLALGATALMVCAFAQQSQDYVASIVGKPYLLIQRIGQLDNLARDARFTKDRTDIYAIVTVNGVKTETRPASSDDAWPNWEIPLDDHTRLSHVHVRIMDADRGLDKNADQGDINPLGGEKDLDFTYDRETGLLSGDLYGRTNQILERIGAGDNDACRIRLGVMKVRL
ncbi:MAG: hypothetical protein JSS66_12730 [Armatimonadetes bacterium]|nr:hypothetical protein [Armatimonadota bacterium]